MSSFISYKGHSRLQSTVLTFLWETHTKPASRQNNTFFFFIKSITGKMSHFPFCNTILLNELKYVLMVLVCEIKSSLPFGHLCTGIIIIIIKFF